MAAAERSSAARADRNRQQRAQKDLDTSMYFLLKTKVYGTPFNIKSNMNENFCIAVAECLSKISELEMEVSSKEEVNARLQAAHIEEVTALANDIKGLKVSITLNVHMFLVANFHFHSKVFYSNYCVGKYYGVGI